MSGFQELYTIQTRLNTPHGDRRILVFERDVPIPKLDTSLIRALIKPDKQEIAFGCLRRLNMFLDSPVAGDPLSLSQNRSGNVYISREYRLGAIRHASPETAQLLVDSQFRVTALCGVSYQLEALRSAASRAETQETISKVQAQLTRVYRGSLTQMVKYCDLARIQDKLIVVGAFEEGAVMTLGLFSRDSIPDAFFVYLRNFRASLRV